MLHIFEVGVDIDLDKIKESIATHAEEKVIEEILKEVKSVIFAKNSWYGNGYNENDNSPMRELVRREVEKIISEHKNEIIEMAANNLAIRLAKTKKAKEKLDELIEGAEE